MYQCRKCGGNIKFDIESQLLKCNYCGHCESPAFFAPDKDAYERRLRTGEYEVTIFTCSQCGAEIISDDTTAATFCDFCGGTAILDSRISNEKCPDTIIPFKKSKKDCKDAYKKLMKRSVFAPSEMKKEENLERFRGIYMPFWLYDFEKKGPFQYEGAHTKTFGDYYTTHVWKMESDAEIFFKDIPYDATSSFADNLSSAITPFDMSEAVPFAPPYLSGFYADTNDVDASVYRKEAAELIGGEVHKHLQSKGRLKKYEISKNSVVESLLSEESDGRLALMPVWFLSYRNKDRVCYAVVNGQTGKAAADVPVDYGKYLLGSLILAIPLFMLFQFVFSFNTVGIVIIAAFYALICATLSLTMKKKLKSRETYSDDIGMIYRMEQNRKNMEFPDVENPEDENTKNQTNAENNKSRKESSFSPLIFALNLTAVLGGILVFLICSVVVIALIAVLRLWSGSMILFLISIIIFFTTLWVQIFSNIAKRIKQKRKIKEGNLLRKLEEQEKKEKLSFKEIFPTAFITALALIPAALVLLIQPVSDLYYFAVAVCVILLNTFSVLMLIRKYNLLTTRELPQFNKRGGEENE